MVDYDALRKKFPAKGPLHRKSSRAAVKAVAREFEAKRAELTGGPPLFHRGPLFYGLITIVLVMLGGLVFTAGKGRISFGKQRIDRKSLQARKSMDALAVALGRYKFHVGSYPSDTEGLNVLALKSFRKQGWDGPYVNHIVSDPWGNDYVYETNPDGGHPVLYSKGPDGRAGTTDDVLPDQASFDEPFIQTTWTNGWAPYRLRGIVVAPDEATRRRVQEEMRQYDP